MKKIIIPLIAAALFIVGVGLLTQKVQTGNISWPSNDSAEEKEKSEVKIDDLTIPVEVAKTDLLRRRGLSKRSSLPEAEGMLFVFTEKDIKPPFWMKDMLIPIDIIWINDSKIVEINSNIQPPEPNTEEKDLILYIPDQPIDYVLEVNAGFSDINNLQVGDNVEIPSSF